MQSPFRCDLITDILTAHSNMSGYGFDGGLNYEENARNAGQRSKGTNVVSNKGICS